MHSRGRLPGTENDTALQKQTGRARSINRHQWKMDDLEAALENPDRHHRVVLDALKGRIRIRREQPAFHPNATQYTLHLGPSLFAFWRESINRNQSIFAVHNISDRPQTISLIELNLIATETWRDLLSDTIYQDLQGSIELAPYACVWISNR